MSNSLLMLVVLSALSAAPDSTVPESTAPESKGGLQLRYEGRFEALRGDPEATRKAFDLAVLARPAGEGGASVHWVLREEGFGGWPWTGRLGRYAWNERGAVTGDLPSLLHERESGKSVVPVPPLRLPGDAKLADGMRWTRGKDEYEVVDGKTRNGHETWRVSVSNPYGHQRTLWLDKPTGLLVALRANVTIGQGERHELALDLVDSTELPGARADQFQKPLDTLLALRERLGIDPRSETVNWKPEQLEVLREALRDVDGGAAAGEPVRQLVSAALQDANDQKGRANAVAVLREDVLGKPLAELRLETDKGRPFDQDSLKDQVTVLHFWEYRDSPLEEPYGQVGYVDYLYRQRKDDGVAVYGVTVDSKLADPDKRFGAIRAAKRMQSFMNLSYPLLLDAGQGVRALGDPRATGAKLPLVLVIDRQGRVAHYHVGFYDVDPRKGMVELDQAVDAALGK